MKVIVNIEDSKYFDGKEYIWPEIGDVISLPSDIAEIEIAAKRVSKFDDENGEEGDLPKKKKKKAVK